MSELIDRQQALDIFDDYNVSVENGELEAYSRDRKRLCELPTIQPEPHDLVSRRAALEAMDTWDKFGCDPDGKLVRYDDDKHYIPYVHYEDMVRAVKNLPSVQPEPQWIPVERGFPEDYTDVLVWFEYFRYGDYNCLYQTHGIGTYVANYNSWTINHESGWKDLRVIAWMPLPEAYKPNK